MVVRLKLKVVPRSGRTCFAGIMDDGTYRVRLKSPPVDGRANEELTRWLAGEFSCGRTGVSIVSGSSSRTKMIDLEDPGRYPDWYVR